MASEIVKEWINEDGVLCREYASGAILDVKRGRLIGNINPPITKENSSQLRALYKQKTARALRASISRATFGPEITNKPIQAVADVGGQLWKDIVLNERVHPRYRLESWQAIARHAELLGDDRQNESPGPGLTIELGADLARELLSRLASRARNGNNGG